MMNNDFTNKIIADVTPSQLQRIYARLKDEEKPYELNVKAGRGKRIELYCDKENEQYFKNVIYAD